VVSDLHGMYDLLIAHLARIEFNKDADRLFSVGDLIDRGPDSERCIRLLDENWFYSVRGNHEQMMLDSFKSGDYKLWLANGGLWIAGRIGVEKDYFEDLAESMPLAIQVGNIGIVHAEPPYDWDLIEECQPENLIWSRSKVMNNNPDIINNIGQVYAGHTIIPCPVELGNVKYIDTGAYSNGRLTVLEMIHE